MDPIRHRSKNRMHLLLLMSMVIFLMFPKTSEAGNKTDIVFKCDWHHGVQFMGFYVALQKGFYDDEGLNVRLEELTAAHEVNTVAARVASGHYDFSIGSYILALAQSKGMPLVALSAIYQFGPQVFFSKKAAGLKHPRDFKGMRIVDKGASWRRLLKEFLTIGGLTLGDVSLVKGGYDMTPFYEDKIDIWGGYITNEAISAREQGFQIDTFPVYEYDLHHFGSNIYTTLKTVRERPRIVRAFLTATVRGWDYAVKNTAEAVEIMLAMFPEKANKRSFHLRSFEASIPLVIPPGKRVGDPNCDNYKRHPLLSALETDAPICNPFFMEDAWNDLKRK